MSKETRLLWGDGHHDEPSSRIYIDLSNNNKIIETLDELVEAMRNYSKLLQVDIENGLI